MKYEKRMKVVGKRSDNNWKDGLLRGMLGFGLRGLRGLRGRVILSFG